MRIWAVALLLVPVMSFSAYALGASKVMTKIGSGAGTVTPGNAIVPPGASLDFVISTPSGVISYVTLDNSIVSVFKAGGIGKSMAIATVPANGKSRTLIVYFSMAGNR